MLKKASRVRLRYSESRVLMTLAMMRPTVAWSIPARSPFARTLTIWVNTSPASHVASRISSPTRRSACRKRPASGLEASLSASNRRPARKVSKIGSVSSLLRAQLNLASTLNRAVLSDSRSARTPSSQNDSEMTGVQSLPSHLHTAHAWHERCLYRKHSRKYLERKS